MDSGLGDVVGHIPQDEAAINIWLRPIWQDLNVEPPAFVSVLDETLGASDILGFLDGAIVGRVDVLSPDRPPWRPKDCLRTRSLAFFQTRCC